jgi:hypothetical protein
MPLGSGGGFWDTAQGSQVRLALVSMPLGSGGGFWGCAILLAMTWAYAGHYERGHLKRHGRV